MKKMITYIVIGIIAVSLFFAPLMLLTSWTGSALDAIGGFFGNLVQGVEDTWNRVFHGHANSEEDFIREVDADFDAQIRYYGYGVSEKFRDYKWKDEDGNEHTIKCNPYDVVITEDESGSLYTYTRYAEGGNGYDECEIVARVGPTATAAAKAATAYAHAMYGTFERLVKEYRNDEGETTVENTEDTAWEYQNKINWLGLQLHFADATASAPVISTTIKKVTVKKEVEVTKTVQDKTQEEAEAWCKKYFDALDAAQLKNGVALLYESYDACVDTLVNEHEITVKEEQEETEERTVYHIFQQTALLYYIDEYLKTEKAQLISSMEERGLTAEEANEKFEKTFANELYNFLQQEGWNEATLFGYQDYIMKSRSFSPYPYSRHRLHELGALPDPLPEEWNASNNIFGFTGWFSGDAEKLQESLATMSWEEAGGGGVRIPKDTAEPVWMEFAYNEGLCNYFGRDPIPSVIGRGLTYQCTGFAAGRFFLTYGMACGAGDGVQVAEETAENPKYECSKYFHLVNDISQARPNSIVSFDIGDEWGHVAYIEDINFADKTVIISEGHGSDGSINICRTLKFSDFGNVTIAVPNNGHDAYVLGEEAVVFHTDGTYPTADMTLGMYYPENWYRPAAASVQTQSNSGTGTGTTPPEGSR